MVSHFNLGNEGDEDEGDEEDEGDKDKEEASSSNLSQGREHHEIFGSTAAGPRAPLDTNGHLKATPYQRAARRVNVLSGHLSVTPPSGIPSPETSESRRDSALHEPHAGHLSLQNDQLERAMQRRQRDGWNVGVLPAGTLTYKGMDPKLDHVMSNDDIRNCHAQSQSWFGDIDVARKYAIRSTAKVYMSQERLFGQLEDFDPQVASIAQFRARRDVVLLSLLDQDNVRRLLDSNQDRIQRQLDTPIGKRIQAILWETNAEALPSEERYDLLHKLNREKVNNNIREAIDGARRNGDITVPLGLTDSEIEYQIKQQMVNGRKTMEVAKKTVRKRNIKVANKVIDELIRLQAQRHAIRFATGYGMGWDGQKLVLGSDRLAKRQLMDRKGPGPEEFNRVSLKKIDLELLNALKEYVNVDGYWAPRAESVWHKDGRFHSEMAVFDPKSVFEFTGYGVSPRQARSWSEGRDDSHNEKENQY